MNRMQTREQNKQRLIDAAYTEFVQNGYDGTSIRDIADRANMTSGLVYYYFKTKDELLLAVQSSAQQQYHELYQSTHQPSDLRDSLREVQARVIDNPDWYRWRYELFALGVKRPELQPQVAQVLREGRDSLRRQLVVYVSSDEANDLAALLVACFDGLALQRLVDDTVDNVTVYDMLATVLESYFTNHPKEELS
ncbi:MAG: TetR/AcrR family transcriptional regulator [Chloroflexi bacterium]|nr:MAG: TetR/AcrR family transcriptional regulator [Chloroflexota bacterium]